MVIVNRQNLTYILGTSPSLLFELWRGLTDACSHSSLVSEVDSVAVQVRQSHCCIIASRLLLWHCHAEISRTNWYQALALRFYFSSGWGENLGMRLDTLLVVIIPIHLSYHSAQGLMQLSLAVGHIVGTSVGGWLQEARWCCHLATH